MIWKSMVIWLFMAVLAVINGTTRNVLFTPRYGEHAGHVISTIILCALIFALSLMSIRWISPSTMGNAVLIGVFWVVLTVAFEFVAGHYLFGNSWAKLTADYNIGRGRIWLLVLITSFVSPAVAATLRGL